MKESDLAGEAGRAAEEEGTSTISKAETSVRFGLCLGLLMNIHVIAGPAFVTLRSLGVT